jgi:hypothetical protein
MHKGEGKHSEPEFGSHALPATTPHQHQVTYRPIMFNCATLQVPCLDTLTGTEELHENQKVAGFVLQLFPSCLRTVLFR